MTDVWVESLGQNFESALALLASAIRDCPDALWSTSMWVVPAPAEGVNLVDSDGARVSDPDARLALIQRHSTPWSISWHALEVLDYDLGGELVPWTPPAPFTGKAHWRDLTTLPSGWTRSEMLGYVDHCKQRALDTLSDMTDEKAATPLPQAHRYHGRPYAWLLAGLPLHTVEHGSQIRQFITSSAT